MKKITDAIPFLSSLIAIDLLVFFMLYFLHATLMKGFPVSEAAAKGGYELLWRLISLQLVLQIAILLALSFFGQHKNFFFVMVGGILSVVIAISIAYSVAHIPKLLSPPSATDIGEGFAIIVSLSVAWISMRFITT